MGFGYWTTVVYCANCDGTIRADAKTCPHCGIDFPTTDKD